MLFSSYIYLRASYNQSLPNHFATNKLACGIYAGYPHTSTYHTWMSIITQFVCKYEVEPLAKLMWWRLPMRTSDAPIRTFAWNDKCAARFPFMLSMECHCDHRHWSSPANRICILAIVYVRVCGSCSAIMMLPLYFIRNNYIYYLWYLHNSHRTADGFFRQWKREMTRRKKASK